jgi:hypothetical protein
MEHRRFLAHPEVHRPFVGSGLFARIGGPATVGVLVDGLYDRIENDAALRAREELGASAAVCAVVGPARNSVADW